MKRYERQILQCLTLAVTVMCACEISHMVGWCSGGQKAPAVAGSEGGTEKTTSQYTDLPPGSPSLLFPSGMAFQEATSFNVDITDSQVLNLAHPYENGAGSAGPADSYAGRLYDILALKDAPWISGLYDLYSHTPQQLASLSGLPGTAVTSPSSIIPKPRNLFAHSANSGLQETGSTPNAREIISIINTPRRCDMLKDMKTMGNYTDRLWNASHECSVSMGDIYYCDGSYLYEVTAGQPAADEFSAEGAGGATAVAPASDISYPGTATFDTALPASSRIYPDYVDCTALAMLKGTEEADSLLQVVDSLEAVKTFDWTDWNAHTMNITGVLLAQDWSQEHGLYTADYPVKGLPNSREIERYMGLIPEDASQQWRDFVQYVLTSASKIPYYRGGKPSAPGYTDNSSGFLTIPDEDGRILKGLGCSGWVNWIYWSVAGRGLGAQNARTLLGSGIPVSRDELLSGDICIRFDSMTHVVMFLGWTAEENMLCIQETTRNSNNMGMGAATSDWESYRRILE